MACTPKPLRRLNKAWRKRELARDKAIARAKGRRYSRQRAGHWRMAWFRSCNYPGAVHLRRRDARPWLTIGFLGLYMPGLPPGFFAREGAP